jgi:alpha-galactosidase
MPLNVEDQGGKIVITNAALSFTFSLRHGRFIVRPANAGNAPALLNATAQAVYKSGPRTISVRMDEQGSIVYNGAPGRDAHGASQHSLFYWTGDEARLGLTVVMYEDLPYMLLRLTLTHRAEHPIQVESLTPVLSEARHGGGLSFECPPERMAFLRNGWASWSPSAAAFPGEVPLDGQFTRHTRQAYLNAGTPAGSKTDLWSESYTVVGTLPGAPGERRTGLVAGFVSLADQFTAIGAEFPPAKGEQTAPFPFQMTCQDDQLTLARDTSLSSEWGYLEWVDLSQDDPLATYVAATARHMEARTPARGPQGWTSWHTAGGNVAEAAISGALAGADQLGEELPIELIQLDAGYADLPGDWMQVNSTRFPQGMPALAEQIRARGRIPGIWLAPFVVHPDTLIAADHPDWLLRDGSRPVAAGMLDGVNIYALDTTHPEVLEWLGDLIRRVRREWGFPYIKLDFLYAAALPGKRHDATMTRAQALRRALAHVREVAGPDTFLAAAGCPLGPAQGLVNAMRIAPDNGPAWFTTGGRWGGLFKPGPAAPGARNAVRNTMTRSTLHRHWWLNDPDALVLGELSLGEAQSVASVAGLSGGLRLLGDDLQQLDASRRALAAALIPEIPEFAVALDLLEREMPERYVLRMQRPCGQWSVAAVFNWSDNARDLTVRPADWGVSAPLHVYDFWARQYHRLSCAEFMLPQVPAHGCVVLGLRPLAAGPHLVGTSFHISQGGELADWQAGPGGLSFTINIGRAAEGEVLVWTPSPVRAATAGGVPATFVDLGGGVTAVRLAVTRTARVEVRLS